LPSWPICLTLSFTHASYSPAVAVQLGPAFLQLSLLMVGAATQESKKDLHEACSAASVSAPPKTEENSTLDTRHVTSSKLLLSALPSAKYSLSFLHRLAASSSVSDPSCLSPARPDEKAPEFVVGAPPALGPLPPELPPPEPPPGLPLPALGLPLPAAGLPLPAAPAVFPFAPSLLPQATQSESDKPRQTNADFTLMI